MGYLVSAARFLYHEHTPASYQGPHLVLAGEGLDARATPCQLADQAAHVEANAIERGGDCLNMALKRETLASARAPEELYDQLEAKAKELELFPPSQDLRNDWGPIYFNDHFDLRIDKQAGAQHYSLMLLHKLQPPTGLLGRLKNRS